MEWLAHVGEPGRVVLVVDLSAPWIQHLWQRVERHVVRPDVRHAARLYDDAVRAPALRKRRYGTVPELQDVASTIRMGEARVEPCAHTHGALPLGQRGRAHHPEKLLSGAKGAVHAGAEDVK